MSFNSDFRSLGVLNLSKQKRVTRWFWAVLMTLLIASSAMAADPKDVVASFRGGQITLGEVDQEIASKPIFARYREEHPGKQDELRKTVLNTMINRQLLLGVVQSSGKVDDKEVAEAVKKVVDGYGGKEKLTDLLQKISTPYEKFIADITNDYRLQSYVKNAILPSIKVSEKDIKEEFEKNRAQYDLPESVHARHILLKLDSSSEDEEAIKKKIKGLRKKLTDENAKFDAVAKELSQCPSAESGGDLGVFTRGQMVPEFEKAAFSLKAGEVSEPIKTQFGYHLIKVEEHNKSVPAELETSSNSIKDKLLKVKSDSRVNALVEKLRKSANVKVDL